MRWITQDRSLDPVITALEEEVKQLRAENQYLKNKALGPDHEFIASEDTNILPKIDDYMTLQLASKSAIKMTDMGIRLNARSYQPNSREMEWGIFINGHALGGDKRDRNRYLADVAVQAVRSIGDLYDIEIRGDDDLRLQYVRD